MAAGVEAIPVLSAAPKAEFVNPRYGGRKPIGAVEWTTEKLTPEEIAVTIPIPNAFIDDAGFPVWESVRGEVAAAVWRCFDAAALFGTDAPATYPSGGLVGLAAAAPAGATGGEAVSNAFDQVEGQGLEVNGILGGPSLNSVFRNAALAYGAPQDLAATPERTLWGVAYATTPTWDASAGFALVGDWQYVVVGVREDIRFDLSTEGVLTDDSGTVVVNAFQDDSTLLRCYVRLGIAVGTPLGPDGETTIDGLALAELDATRSASTRRSRSSASSGGE
jgi:hypothetical protein